MVYRDNKVEVLGRELGGSSPLSSSFLGWPSGILNINHKKELLRGLWAGSRAYKGFRFRNWDRDIDFGVCRGLWVALYYPKP